LFNKIDLVLDPVERKKLSVNYPDALFVSAFSNSDMKMVKEHIAEIIRTYKKDAAAADIISRKTKELNRDPNEVTGLLPWEQK